jgi:hypothetical protein
MVAADTAFECELGPELEFVSVLLLQPATTSALAAAMQQMAKLARRLPPRAAFTCLALRCIPLAFRCSPEVLAIREKIRERQVHRAR